MLDCAIIYYIRLIIQPNGMSHLKNRTAETEKSEDFSVATRLLWCREVHKCLVHVAALDMRRLFSADLTSL